VKFDYVLEEFITNQSPQPFASQNRIERAEHSQDVGTSRHFGRCANAYDRQMTTGGSRIFRVGCCLSALRPFWTGE
jgi:hypothetical protein